MLLSLRPMLALAVVVLGSQLLAAASADAQTARTPSVNLKSYRVVLYGLPEFDCVSVKGLGVDILASAIKKAKQEGKPAVLVHSRIHDLRLERRFTMDREFHKWIQAARAGNREPKDGVVMLLDGAGKPIVRFSFYQAKPKKWEINIPPIDAKSAFVTETVTLSVQDMEMEYDLPMTGD